MVDFGLLFLGISGLQGLGTPVYGGANRKPCVCNALCAGAASQMAVDAEQAVPSKEASF